MADERCRITVVGERRSVDLAVPAHAPIAEYVPMLADMCGQADSDAMPAAWSLAPAGGAPFEPGQSLGAVGVLDGETLYLRDVLQGELDGPVAADIAEQVAELDDDGVEWNTRTRAYTTLALGLVVALAGAGALGIGSYDVPVLGPVLFAAGVASAALAWVAGLKAWPLPLGLRLALAMAACPFLALAALVLPLSGAASLVAVVVTASIGAFAAYLAVPAISTMVLQLVCGLVVVPAIALAALRADRTEAAAVVAVVTFFLIGALPRISAQVAAVPPGPAQMEDVEATVRRIQRLLIFLNALCCLVVAVCLVVLSGADDWFALGLVLSLSLALLCRASTSRLRAVVAAVLAGAVTGLTALVLRAPGHVFGPHGHLTGAHVPGWSAPLVTLTAGVLVVWWGLVLCFRSSLQSADFADRWSWPGPFANFLGALSVPLAAGVFGVFDALMKAGGRM
ncbi:EsaB/YukD family protein [Actinoallomurus rhizosphaericola]|uniref:EsaB/YukD family protein n=1 Tax=Actinoallomurus rhizosphaericola TaxID=2952536 RepID=UPI00209331EF|nr:EsaB/YukD family protein [Actinoallomurus rhizosphaericola]MCO6000184.1 EsaB/YukD family protein [Actinoallomurus rhizosphaericola]